MNKQELIEKIEARNVCDLAVSDSFKNGFNTMKGIAVDLASELDEPVKPEVTQFVADWYEQHKDILDYSIWEACVNSRADYDDLEGTTGNEFYDWLINAGGEDGKRERITLLIRMKDGYTVKQEPKYIVKLPMVNWNDEASELQDDFAFLILDITSDETRISGSDKDFKTWIARLTEREIKSIDERYWAFAVPVDGSVEEV